VALLVAPLQIRLNRTRSYIYLIGCCSVSGPIEAAKYMNYLEGFEGL